MEKHTFHIMGSYLSFSLTIYVAPDGTIARILGGLLPYGAIIGSARDWWKVQEPAKNVLEKFILKDLRTTIADSKDIDNLHAVLVDITNDANIVLKELIEDNRFDYSYDYNAASLFGPLQAEVGAGAMQDFQVTYGSYLTADGLVAVMPDLACMTCANKYPI